MSQHINRFIDRIRAAESRQQRDIILSIADARDLRDDITRLLLILQEAAKPQVNSEEITEVQITGGNF